MESERTGGADSTSEPTDARRTDPIQGCRIDRMTQPAESWSPELDALLAAPAHHRLLLENDSVRVLDTRIAPGETVALHTHKWPAVNYVLAAGEFVRRDHTGAVVADSRLAPRALSLGEAVWSPPLGPHTLENVGRTSIHIISVEVKSGPTAQ